MELSKIRALRLAQPFRPFSLVMNDGRKRLVDRNIYLAISPNGRHMLWSSMDGGWERVRPEQVSEVIPLTPRRSNGSPKKARRRKT